MTDLLELLARDMTRDLISQQEQYLQSFLDETGLTIDQFNERYELELHPTRFTILDDFSDSVVAKARQEIRIKAKGATQ